MVAEPKPADQAQAQRTYREALYASYVSTHAGALSATSRDALAAYFRANILRHLPTDRTARIADIACGAGELLSFLRRERFVNTVGVDASDEQVRLARDLGNSDVLAGDAFALLASRPASFDAIVAVDFLEHLTKDEVSHLLRLVRASLRPGGVFIAQTCNAGSPMFGRIRYGDVTHETAFTDRSMVQVLLAAELRPVGVYGIDPTPHGARSMARALAWRGIKAAATAYLAVETGVLRGHIVSQNLIAVARRDDAKAAGV